MNGSALIFFILFGLTIVAIYLGVRRGWASVRLITLVGAAASIVLMALFSLAQGNVAAQAIVVGVLVGSIFTAAAVSIANFFRTSESQGRSQPPGNPD